MPFSLRKEIHIPDISVDMHKPVVNEDDSWLAPGPSPKITASLSTDKAQPSIRVEKTLSKEEMLRLHELWNGAGLSARAHRRKHEGSHPLRRTPAPISIPEPGDIPPAFSSADPTIASTTPSTAGTRKRRGFLSARPFFEKEAAEKGRGVLEALRAMAQDRLKKKLRYAKSAPNLADKATLSNRVPLQLIQAVPMPDKVVPKDAEVIGPHTPVLSSGTFEGVLELGDMDENAIYFTMDPSWHGSEDSLQIQFITPIPNSPTTLGRPDSPLLHRHFSLDQLTFAAQQVTKTLSTMECTDPVECTSDETLRLVDELHAYLELGTTALTPHRPASPKV